MLSTHTEITLIKEWQDTQMNRSSLDQVCHDYKSISESATIQSFNPAIFPLHQF